MRGSLNQNSAIPPTPENLTRKTRFRTHSPDCPGLEESSDLSDADMMALVNAAARGALAELPLN